LRACQRAQCALEGTDGSAAGGNDIDRFAHGNLES
jgi:hypothetical protein